MLYPSQLLSQTFPPPRFFLLLGQGPVTDCGFPGSARGRGGLHSQSNAHSLHSTPPKSSSSILPPSSAETSRRTACSPTSGTGFSREVQGQARSPRDAPGGPGYRDCRRWRGPSWEELCDPTENRTQHGLKERGQEACPGAPAVYLKLQVSTEP